MKKLLLSILSISFFISTAIAQLNVTFSISYISNGPCAPGAVAFTSSSTGQGPLKYSWSFSRGNPSSSNIQSPAVEYSVCGDYPVTLTVTDNNGSKSKTDTVHFLCMPTANFGLSDTSGCIPLTVNFINKSIAGSGSISDYKWDFCDGDSSHLMEPIHIYSIPGCYCVKLTITNSNGCRDTAPVAVVCARDTPQCLLNSIPNRSIKGTFIKPFNPNPAIENAMLEYYVLPYDKLEIIFTDLTGQKVKQYFLNPNNHSFMLNTNDWNNSMYLYSVYKNGVRVMGERLVIMK